MLNVTKAMKMISRATADDPTIEAKLIQARVEEHIRPNLDLITLPKLGDLEYLGSGHTILALPISRRCAPQSAVATSDLFKERGIFGLCDRPSGRIGSTYTVPAWGLNKKAQWLQIEFDVCKQGYMAHSWDEVLTDLRIKEVPLDKLLAHMKSLQRGKKSGGVWQYRDRYGTDHYVFSDPGTIWYTLTRFILDWHKGQRKKYVRSKRFTENVLLEDMAVENFSKLFL